MNRTPSKVSIRTDTVLQQLHWSSLSHSVFLLSKYRQETLRECMCY